ncbi:MAG: SURF1 family protein [Mycobacteriales bacterium]
MLRQPRYAVLLAIAVLIATGCCIAGVWQIHRYDLKHSTNDTLRGSDHAAITPVGDLLTTRPLTGDRLQFRRVSATGHYDPAGQLLVRQREVNDSPAYLIMTPLRIAAGPTLLVVRGWLPANTSADRRLTGPTPPTGPVTIVARVYPSEPARSEAGLPAGQIDRLSVPAIAARLGTTTYGGYAELIDQTPTPHGLRVLPGPDMSNPAGGAFEPQHLAYVGQWFIFALIALGAPYVLIRIDRRGGPRRERATIAAPVANRS